MALDLLLRLAQTAPDAAASSLGSSIRQQLQQSGVLQQLAAVMTVMAADLQAEAAALAAGDGDTASRDIEQLITSTPNLGVLKAMGVQYQLMCLWGTRTSPFGLDFAPSVSWLWGPSGQVVAVMQLHTALLQHASALVQHVQQRMPQQANALLGRLAANWQAAKPDSLRLNITAALCNAVDGVEEQPDSADTLQVLLLSPHTLPFVAMMLVIYTAGVKRAMPGTSGRKQAGASSSGSASSSRRCSTGSAGQQVQAAASDHSSSSSGASEQQLLQLLGLAPEVIAMMDPPKDLVDAALRVCMTNTVATGCYKALSDTSMLLLSVGDPHEAERVEQVEQQQRLQQPQRELAQQLQLLLATVLLRSAHNMLTPSARDLQKQLPQVSDAVQRLLLWSCSTLQLSALLLESQALPVAPAPAVWLRELLGVLLQLTDQLLYQQPPSLAEPTAATAGTAASSSSNSRKDQMTLALCVQKMLSMLLGVAEKACTLLLQPSGSTSSGSTCSEGADSNPDSMRTALSPVAARFVEFGTALEIAMRAVTQALQSGIDNSSEPPANIGTLCSSILLPGYGQASAVLVQHMGLCGPVALAQEQRQLYSLLSTVLKMGRCKSAGVSARPCWGEWAAGSCCLAAAHAAVALLNMAAPVRSGGSGASTAPTGQQSHAAAPAAGAAPAATVAAPAPAAAAAAVCAAAAAAPANTAAAQQVAVDYLPSLVIFGRCCLLWAEQLIEQTPYLLLLASGAVPQQQVHAWRHHHSVYFSCIAPKQPGAAGKTQNVLNSLIDITSGWVASVESQAVFTHLEAAGCAQQQLLRQLDLLLSAQQGVHPKKPTDASITALVQQLQATGRMLCNIAVPHFCNNPACGSISGRTEVQLVSGRSCVCAGCRTARYCGRACQRAAWKQHKPVCEALAAAAAATAASVMGS
jgi:hypothetical protein